MSEVRATKANLMLAAGIIFIVAGTIMLFAGHPVIATVNFIIGAMLYSGSALRRRTGGPAM